VVFASKTLPLILPVWAKIPDAMLRKNRVAKNSFLSVTKTIFTFI
jgi:hypothetical protein